MKKYFILKCFYDFPATVLHLKIKLFNMKSAKILQAALLVTAVVFMTSCSSSRYYAAYPPPPPRASFSLIINPFPGIVVSRYHDGRYYYRDRWGHTYWRGYDNRYYLDRAYLGRTRYDKREYHEWKNFGRRSNGHHHH
jgi:hypothetical protein